MQIKFDKTALRRMRIKSGVDRSAMSRELGLNFRMVEEWENGNLPKALYTVAKLLKYHTGTMDLSLLIKDEKL